MTEGISNFCLCRWNKGWINVEEESDTVKGAGFITTSGGTIATCGDFKIHTFTGPGTFTVSSSNKLYCSRKMWFHI